MKRNLFFIAAMFLLCLMSAQSFINRAFHTDSQFPVATIAENSGDLYFSTLRLGSPYGLCYLYRMDANGTVKFKTTVLGFSTVVKLSRSLDKKLIVSGVESSCDVYEDMQKNFIAKVDTSGNVIFNKQFSTHNGDHPVCTIQVPDSTFYTFTDSLVFHHSKTGQFISKANLGLSKISSALLYQNSDILLGAKSSAANVLVLFSPGTGLGTLTPAPALLKKMAIYGAQKLVGLGTDSKLYKFSATFNSTGTSTVLATDFSLRSDSIYCITGSKYFISDTSFNVIASSTNTTNAYQQKAITHAGSKVAILGTGSTTQNYVGSDRIVYFASLSVMDKYSTNNFSNDITITSVESDSAYFSSSPSRACLRASVTVKNRGNSAIERFTLNSPEDISFICGQNSYQELFTGLSLLPGDSITVTTSRFIKRSTGYQKSFQFCFFTTIPNDETDKTPENDQFCFDFGKVSSINEAYLFRELSVFPNPSDKDFIIKSSATINSVEVYDIIGQLVSQEKSNASEASVGTNLKAGVYFLKINTDKGLVTKKVLKN